MGEVLPIQAGDEWIDVGTGGGLPGLVLALTFPESLWTLVDATRKKIEIVRSFAETLGLENVQCRHGRAETLAREPGMRAHFAGAVSRAVGALPVVLELSRGFVRPGGVIVAIRGRTWPAELDTAQDAIRALRLTDIHSARVGSMARETWVVSMRADGPVPARYPRRDGIPRSEPLGAKPLGGPAK